MSLNTIELSAIAVCENCYNQKKKRLLGIFLFRRFQFNKNIVLESKNLYEFWLNFGLKNTDKINFTEEEKLNCLQTCYPRWCAIALRSSLDCIAFHPDCSSTAKDSFNPPYL